MTAVVVTATARNNLTALITTHGLPGSTRDRVMASIGPLAEFPHLGRALLGRWAGHRLILGPWPWMLVLCRFNVGADQVVIVTIQDARRSSSATALEA